MNRAIQIARIEYDSFTNRWTLSVDTDSAWSSRPRPTASDLPADIREALRKWLDES